MEITFDKYYNNEELEQFLQWCQEQNPDIVELGVLGQSYEDNPMLLVILTNKKTGRHSEKPAFWVDGNLHATEVCGCMAACYLIHKIITQYPHDKKIQRIVDEQTIYVVPRLNPDGAQLALNSKPLYLRSGTRPYPHQDKEDGLHTCDIDDDGRILQMRVEDPTGDWKISNHDPKLMVKREPDEEEGTFYRVFPEGYVENYDGHLIKIASDHQGLDFNRNFPWFWRPEGEQKGSGDYPTSEPEVRAVVDFFTHHKNIFGAITYHTFSRVMLRPFSNKSDDEMDTDDLWTFDTLGEKGEALTQYAYASVFHDFKYHPKSVISGTFDDWLYEHKGIFGFTIELWDLPSAAGIEEKNKTKNFIDWFRKHPLEHDLKIADFVEENIPGGLVEWYKFDHPQLGEVELGGWDRMYSWRNPPCHLLQQEIEPQADFALFFAALAPRITWRDIYIDVIAENLYHITAVIENKGFLPTQVSNQAEKLKAVHPIMVEIDLPKGTSLRSGLQKQQIGHLQGRANKQDIGYHATSPTDNRKKLEWVVSGSADSSVTIHVKAERAGNISYTIPFSSTEDCYTGSLIKN